MVSTCTYAMDVLYVISFFSTKPSEYLAGGAVSRGGVKGNGVETYVRLAEYGSDGGGGGWRSGGGSVRGSVRGRVGGRVGDDGTDLFLRGDSVPIALLCLACGVFACDDGADVEGVPVCLTAGDFAVTDGLGLFLGVTL